MELTRRFPPELLERALSDWRWLPELADKRPLLTSQFGDVFLQGESGVWFLDTLEGVLTREWNTLHELESVLNTAEGQDRFLLGGLVERAFQMGLNPGSAQVLTFKLPPALGGELDANNLEVYDVVVALSILGQLHHQIKDVPPGTKITGLSFEGD